MCFVALEKSFDKVRRKVLEWAMRKKGKGKKKEKERKRKEEVLVRSVMRQNEGAKTRVGVDSEMSKELEVKEGMHQGSVISPFLPTLMVDVVTEFARWCAK